MTPRMSRRTAYRTTHRSSSRSSSRASTRASTRASSRTARRGWPIGLVATLYLSIGFPFLAPALRAADDAEPKATVEIRPLVATLRQGEPLLVAARIGDGLGDPAGAEDGKKKVQVRSGSGTLDEIKLELADPTGKVHIARFPSAVAQRLEIPRMGQTIFFLAEPDGVTIHLDETLPKKPAKGLEKRAWREGDVDLDQPGPWAVLVSGVIGWQKSKGGPQEFRQGFLDFERTDQPLGAFDHDALREAAVEEVLRLEPKAKLVKEPLVVLGAPDGGRIAQVRSKAEMWTEHTYQVAFDASATPVRVTRHRSAACLATGTRVSTPSGEVPIEELAVGDLVLGYDLERGTVVETEVLWRSRARAELLIEFAGGLRVTPVHPVFADGSFRPAADVGAGSRLLGAGGEARAAGPVRVLSGDFEVHDLGVAPPHCFFAEGVLVHNKSRLWSKHLDDAWFRIWPEEGIEELWKKE